MIIKTSQSRINTRKKKKKKAYGDLAKANKMAQAGCRNKTWLPLFKTEFLGIFYNMVDFGNDLTFDTESAD